MLNAINKRLQQAFPLNSESLFDTIQENDTRPLRDIHTRSWYPRLSDRSIHSDYRQGTADYSIQNLTIRLTFRVP